MSSDAPEILISRNTLLDVGGLENSEQAQKRISDHIFNARQKKNTIPTKFYALGGIGEVGKNTYCLEHDNEIILIDAGIKFANKKLFPGVTGTIANLDYLKENQAKIKALFITHGHEDHIGGIAHILKKVKIPVIYTPVIASELIKKKLNEHKIPDQKIVLFNQKSVFSTEHFMLDFFKVNHSIPDSFGIFVSTPNGTVLSSGDFRFDFGSRGDKFDLQKLQQIVVRKIDLLLCESTNSSHPHFNESERVVISELNNIISSSKARVVITFFASNLGRIEEIIKIAISCNRKIVILGRSIDSSIAASQKVGYLKVSKKIFISTSEAQNFPDNEILIICTGSQGEENAVLNTISKNKHQWIKLKPTDNIIFSSNVIPGNTAAVDEVVNRLYKSGCNIFINSPSLKIHSSGHASKLEQQLFMSLVNPKFMIPIHGETRMLKELKKNALELGWLEKNIYILENGSVIHLLNGTLIPTNEVINTDPLFIVGNDLTESGIKILKEREKFGKEGILMFHIFLSLKNRVAHTVSPITNIGSFYLSESFALLKKLNSMLLQKLIDCLKDEAFTMSKILGALTKCAADEIFMQKQQNPLIKILVTDCETKEDIFKDVIVPALIKEKTFQPHQQKETKAPEASSEEPIETKK